MVFYVVVIWLAPPATVSKLSNRQQQQAATEPEDPEDIRRTHTHTTNISEIYLQQKINN